MRFLFLTAALFAARSLHANDGVFYASGNMLVPLKETVVQMKKEVLTLTRTGEYMQVDVYFEFYNPGPEKALLVGFVTPRASGDMKEGEDDAHPQIKGFKVMVNGALLPYKVRTMDSTGINHQKIKANEYDFVYSFNVNFKKGITVVRHSYIYRGGGSVEHDFIFDYVLRTGSTWAGGMIEDFELNVQMGSYINLITNRKPGGAKGTGDWELLGIGRRNPIGNLYGDGPWDMFCMQQGALRYRQRNFRPEQDLAINVPQLHNNIAFTANDEKLKERLMDAVEFLSPQYANYTAEGLKDISTPLLRIIKNYFFAKYGYDFKDKELKDAFSTFDWYIPDPNLQDVHELMTADERKAIDALQKELERRR